jgi:hypothetical protein
MSKSQSGKGKANLGRGKDSPEQAMESGEPRETGRSRGRVIDDRGVAEGTKSRARNAGSGRDPESGRHGAVGGDDAGKAKKRR